MGGDGRFGGMCCDAALRWSSKLSEAPAQSVRQARYNRVTDTMMKIMVAIGSHVICEYQR